MAQNTITDFERFISLFRKYDGVIDVAEEHGPETFRVILTCRGKTLLRHTIIKCTCETADEIRQYVYEKVATELFKMGIDKIEEICGG